MWQRFLRPVRKLGHAAVWRALAAAAAVVAGGWLGLIVAGNLVTEVGPVEAKFSVRPAIDGDTTVHTPPLGNVTFDTHDGPLRVDATVQELRPQAVKRILSDPASLATLGDQVTEDLRSGVIVLVAKSAGASVAGAGVLAAILFRRRWRWTVASAAASALVFAGAGLAGYMTFSAESIQEPRYNGLLAKAPGLFGSVSSLTENFSHYQQELGQLVTNVSRVYNVTSGLTPYQPDPSTIRVLHVSDLHLNPAAWSVMHSVAEQFKVNVIVDSGDIVDKGIPPENRYVDEISTFDVPYVYVRGNHGTQTTQDAVASQPNAVVLNGDAAKVAGLRFFGAGDPRYSRDPATRQAPNAPTLRGAGRNLPQRLRRVEPPPVDIGVAHDPKLAKALDGLVPLILAGHMHDRSTTMLPQGSRLMVQGSTGGAGVRGLSGEYPTPLKLSVLYIDRKTQRLQAWDDIRVGGLGLSSAEITRHVANGPGAGAQPAPTRSPVSPPTHTGPPRRTQPAPTASPQRTQPSPSPTPTIPSAPPP